MGSNSNLNPGKFNKKISIHSQSVISDGAGGYENKLTLIKSVWASIEPITAREYYEARQLSVEITHKIIVRSSEIINRTQVISYDGNLYDIQHIIEDEKAKLLNIKTAMRN